MYLLEEKIPHRSLDFIFEMLLSGDRPS